MKIEQNKLMIKQEVEMLEVFSGFETKNKYRVTDETGQDMYYACEQSGFMARNFLGKKRPLEVMVLDREGQTQMKIARKFFFFKPDYIISTADDKPIGSVKKKSLVSIFSFNIFDEQEQLKYKCSASIKHPWTYKVYENDQEVAMIQKKWSGIGKEMMTDADNFLLDYGSVTDEKAKQLLLGAVFAIDLTKYEEGNKSKNKSMFDR